MTTAIGRSKITITPYISRTLARISRQSLELDRRIDFGKPDQFENCFGCSGNSECIRRRSATAVNLASPSIPGASVYECCGSRKRRYVSLYTNQAPIKRWKDVHLTDIALETMEQAAHNDKPTPVSVKEKHHQESKRRSRKKVKKGYELPPSKEELRTLPGCNYSYTLGHLDDDNREKLGKTKHRRAAKHKREILSTDQAQKCDVASGLGQERTICNVVDGSQSYPPGSERNSSREAMQAEGNEPIVVNVAPEIKTGKGRNKKVPPNAFVAVRVNDPIVKGNAEKLQQAVLNYDESFERAVVPVSTLHVTLLVFRTEGTDEEENARQALFACEDAVNHLFSQYQRTLSFEGVGSFKQGVLFIKLKHGFGQELLTKLAAIVKDTFKDYGVMLTDSDDVEFKPHLTVMKLSKGFTFFKNKKIRKIPQQSYIDYCTKSFGTDKVESLLLCSMKNKTEDGFYKCLGELFIKTIESEKEQSDNEIQEGQGLSESWDNISITDVQKLEKENLKESDNKQPQVKACTIL